MAQEIPYRIAIGTQKAASTYLYNLLKSHPDVALSHRTEVDYYSYQYEKGIDWYLATYSGPRNRIDISPKYFMQGRGVAERIKDTLGETRPKLLLILRNPIEYVNSHFRMQIQQGFFEDNTMYSDFTTNLADFIERYPNYAERGKYHEMLYEQWIPIFPLTDFKIVIFEELVAESTSEKVLNEILEFWELPIHKMHAEAASKNRALRHPVLHRVKDIVMQNEGLKEYLKKQPWFNKLYQNVLTVSSSEALSASDRQRLASVFAEDVKLLQVLLDRDLHEWKNF